MNQQVEKIKQLYKDGILTKEEMEAELKNLEGNKRKSNKRSSLKWIWCIVAAICAIGLLAVIFYDNSDEEVIQNYDTEHLFATGEGSITDRMTIDGKDPILFHLGEFSDIDAYSDFAKKALRGSIEFWICPSKDATRISYIEIRPVFSSAIGSTSVPGDEGYEESLEWGMVGSSIYDRGRKWNNPWGDEMITNAWSPASTLHKVRLTPKAEIEAAKLLQFISWGKITEKNGVLYAGEHKLTKSEIKDMIKFGMLIKKNIFSNPKVSPDYLNAMNQLWQERR